MSSNDTCYTVCTSNNTNDAANSNVVKLTYLTTTFSHWSQPIADDFTASRNGSVVVEFIRIPTDKINDEIINAAITQSHIYDGFLTGPIVSGSIVEYSGWADLTPYVEESAAKTADWADIVLGYRKWISQYEGRVIMFPLDGDLLSMYYRKDVLEHFGLKVPRTWEEYNEVAAAIHGKVYENITMVGSCVGRVKSCGGAYWANLILASMTQTQGPWSGHLFDSSDMTPLTGAALEKTLELLEGQVKYGPPDEFEQCIALNFNYMHDGVCALTYNWGNSFKRYLEAGTHLRGNYAVQPTPGSSYVLDRETKELVDCDMERCNLGMKYDDIGWVNRAPYLAYGGWSCAVNNYTDPTKKQLATEFCAFAASRNVSLQFIIPNATSTDNSTLNGQDPFRESQLDVNLYVQQGYEYETTQMYLDSLGFGLNHENVVTDIRFPTAGDINEVLDLEFHDYLNATKYNLIQESERAAKRKEVVERITAKWQQIISEYDAQGTTKTPILETYQRLLGVYVRNYNLNQIHGIRGYGYALAGLLLASAALFATWAIVYRNTRVVRASQPFFLVMICFGTVVLGSTMFPLGIDDSVASPDAVGKACMSLPWLLSFGWTIVFSALYAKLRRVNIVYQNSMRFRRLKVSEADVLLPFAVLFSINLLFLLIWTIMDPLDWTRHDKGDYESYGTCSSSGDTVVWKVCLSGIAIANGTALILANIEAYKARHVSTEYGESKYIAMAMASMLQIVLVGLPSLFLVDENPSASYFIRSSMVFIISASVLYLIFVPKIYTWLRNKEEQMIRKSERSGGLKVRVYDIKTSETDAKLSEYKKKVKLLEDILRSEGVDADELFARAGLNQMSSVGQDIMEESEFSLRASYEYPRPTSETTPSPLPSMAFSLDPQGPTSSEFHAIKQILEESESEDSDGSVNGEILLERMTDGQATEGPSAQHEQLDLDCVKSAERSDDSMIDAGRDSESIDVNSKNSLEIPSESAFDAGPQSESAPSDAPKPCDRSASSHDAPPTQNDVGEVSLEVPSEPAFDAGPQSESAPSDAPKLCDRSSSSHDAPPTQNDCAEVSLEVPSEPAFDAGPQSESAPSDAATPCDRSASSHDAPPTYNDRVGVEANGEDLVD